jgi:Holliday junction resolvase-like predicted endonuclease
VWVKGDDWFWEGNVQASLMVYLRNQGYDVVEVNTLSKEAGPDILAKRGTESLLVEIKGWPSDRYVDGVRAGTKKATRPSTQAKHWFGEAILTLIRRKHTRPECNLAIGLPDYPKYLQWLDECRWALQVLEISVYLISKEGSTKIWE